MLLLHVVIAILIFASFKLFFFLKEHVRTRILISKFPGPKGPFLMGNFLDIVSIDYASCYKLFRCWANKYAPIYTSSLFEIFAIHIASAEEFEAVASGMSNIAKSKVYNLLRYWLGDGLLTSTGTKWQARRKILTPAFHFSSLQDFVKIFNKEAEQFVENLKTINLDCVNIVPLVSSFTLKSVAEAALDIKLDSSNEDDVRFVKATQKMGKIIFEKVLTPWSHFDMFHYYFTARGYQEKALCSILHNYCNRIIQNKVNTLNNKTTNFRKRLVDVLLKAKNDDQIDEQGIRDEVNTFMFEGHDTTAMSLCFTLMLLAYHQDIQDLVYQEILQVIGKEDQFITITKLNDLKYMERCIKESLRLYPSVPTISRKIEEDLKTRQGYVIPKGFISFIDIIDIHRSPEYWTEPEKYDPDRFLPENCVNRHPFAYVPFSAGPRNCIGQKFAMLELKTLLCKILLTFKMEAIDTPETIVLVQDIVLRPNNEILNIKFLPRQ